jgi:uncharacterized protein YjbI with pentapeptide repeats
VAERQGPTADVQAAVTVLGRRLLPPGGLRPLDLTGVDLRSARLAGANLQHAHLAGANLQGAELAGANLQGAQENRDTRWPTGWDRAQAEARGVRYSD